MGLLDSFLSLLHPTVSPLPDPVISPLPDNPLKIDQYANSLEPTIRNGLTKFSPDTVPMATMSSQLATVGKGLPDPLLPAVIGLMESGGGQHMTGNNPYNIGPNVSYPDLQTAILGGGPNNQRGLQGVLHSGLYDKYLQSGNLEDFFNTFTPPGEAYGNPTLPELLARYIELRKLFQ